MTNDDQVKLAQDILDETVGAAGLTNDQLAILGWDVHKFGYYGRPTADENRDKAIDIIRMAENAAANADEHNRKITDSEYQDSVIARLENTSDALWDDEPCNRNHLFAMSDALELLKALCPRPTTNDNEGNL
ncbi:MAG: hypothetical protein P4L67_04615 [Candidatus Pacebacteria bacterium]|nr:hypothetical protein [Candidatus Paceibacterota bacterium]